MKDVTDPKSKEKTGIRFDRFLWHTRLCKTRTVAIEACQSGDVRVDGDKVKPSKKLFMGDRFSMRRGPITRSYLVRDIVERRVSAKEVEKYLLDETPEEALRELELQKEAHTYAPKRDRGLGRPTKRDLRLIRKLFS